MSAERIKERMLSEARTRTPETTDQLQVDMWRLAEAGNEVPAWKLKTLLYYVEDLEKAISKLSGDEDGGQLPKLRLHRT